MSTPIHKYIETKENELQKAKEIVRKVKILSEKYKDLVVNINRWGAERYSTSEVNEIANCCSFAHSCGCCEDAVLYARPHIVDEELQILIHSNPVDIPIGEKEPYYPDNAYNEDNEQVYFPERYYSNWEGRLKENKISQKVIEQVRTYLKEHAGWEEDD